jgi:hypothetical protein
MQRYLLSSSCEHCVLQNFTSPLLLSLPGLAEFGESLILLDLKAKKKQTHGLLSIIPPAPRMRDRESPLPTDTRDLAILRRARLT